MSEIRKVYRWTQSIITHLHDDASSCILRQWRREGGSVGVSVPGARRVGGPVLNQSLIFNIIFFRDQDGTWTSTGIESDTRNSESVSQLVCIDSNGVTVIENSHNHQLQKFAAPSKRCNFWRRSGKYSRSHWNLKQFSGTSGMTF